MGHQVVCHTATVPERSRLWLDKRGHFYAFSSIMICPSSAAGFV